MLKSGSSGVWETRKAAEDFGLRDSQPRLGCGHAVLDRRISAGCPTAGAGLCTLYGATGTLRIQPLVRRDTYTPRKNPSQLDLYGCR